MSGTLGLSGGRIGLGAGAPRGGALPPAPEAAAACAFARAFAFEEGFDGALDARKRSVGVPKASFTNACPTTKIPRRTIG